VSFSSHALLSFFLLSDRALIRIGLARKFGPLLPFYQAMSFFSVEPSSFWTESSFFYRAGLRRAETFVLSFSSRRDGVPFHKFSLGLSFPFCRCSTFGVFAFCRISRFYSREVIISFSPQPCSLFPLLKSQAQCQADRKFQAPFF